MAGRSGPDSYILPVLALAIGPAVILARIVRVEMVTVLEADFVRHLSRDARYQRFLKLFGEYEGWVKKLKSQWGGDLIDWLKNGPVIEADITSFDGLLGALREALGPEAALEPGRQGDASLEHCQVCRHDDQ